MQPNSETLTDAEVLCEFMEPKPTKGPSLHGANEYWWKWDWRDGEYCWLPRHMALNECRLVEARLTEEQWARYAKLVAPTWSMRTIAKQFLHASAEVKLKALAAVIRSTK